MAADALLHFHSCGVAHLWVAITYQMIQTEPHDEVAGLSDYSCTTLLCFCVQHCPICCKTGVELMSRSFARLDPQLQCVNTACGLDRYINIAGAALFAPLFSLSWV